MDDEYYLREITEYLQEREIAEKLSEEEAVARAKRCLGEVDSKADYLEALDEQIEYYYYQLEARGYDRFLEPQEDC